MRRSRGLGDVYKRQVPGTRAGMFRKKSTRFVSPLASIPSSFRPLLSRASSVGYIMTDAWCFQHAHYAPLCISPILLISTRRLIHRVDGYLGARPFPSMWRTKLAVPPTLGLVVKSNAFVVKRVSINVPIHEDIHHFHMQPSLHTKRHCNSSSVAHLDRNQVQGPLLFSACATLSLLRVMPQEDSQVTM